MMVALVVDFWCSKLGASRSFTWHLREPDWRAPARGGTKKGQKTRSALPTSNNPQSKAKGISAASKHANEEPLHQIPSAGEPIVTRGPAASACGLSRAAAHLAVQHTALCSLQATVDCRLSAESARVWSEKSARLERTNRNSAQCYNASAGTCERQTVCRLKLA